MSRKYLFLLFTLAGCLSACQPDSSQELIQGQWQAVAVLEEGDSLTVDPAEIGFEFYPDGTYHYRSTLNYREAGTYHLKNRFLYTTDTLLAEGKEKAVLIAALTPDSLRLQMNESGQSREMKLVRIEPEVEKEL